MNAYYYEIPTGNGPCHIHVNYEKKLPKEIYVNLPPIGTEISSLASSLGIAWSKYLLQGGNVETVIKHLQSVKSDKVGRIGDTVVTSIPHAMAIALRKSVEKLSASDKKEA